MSMWTTARATGPGKSSTEFCSRRSAIMYYKALVPSSEIIMARLQGLTRRYIAFRRPRTPRLMGLGATFDSIGVGNARF